MLEGGYFTNGSGTGGVGNGSSGSSDNIYLDDDGNIIYAPSDPIFIDDNNNVFLSQGEKNAFIYIEDDKLFVKKVV